MSLFARRTFLAAALGAGVVLGSGVAALAQEDYPTKPITMIIPLGAGGSHDINARVMTSVLSSYLGQPVVVQLMPGASGQTGTAAAAKAKPDGYTLLFTHNFFDQLQQHVTKVPYKPNEDFVTVARTNYAAPYLVVRSDSPFKTAQELIDYGKANPGKLKFGHSGNWGAIMTPGAAFLQEAGINATLVPFQGGGPSFQALLAGDSDFTFLFPSVWKGSEDKVRVLAALGDKSEIPGIPTTDELGYPRAGELGLMHRVVLAPAGVPEDRLGKLREAFQKMTEDKTYQNLLKKLDENNELMDGADYDKLRQKQSDEYQNLVSEITKKK